MIFFSWNYSSESWGKSTKHWSASLLNKMLNILTPCLDGKKLGGKKEKRKKLDRKKKKIDVCLDE